MNPKISILIANYNNGVFITTAINSVLIQTYTNWEIIIVDDCSTDNSIEIITGFLQNDERIKLVRNIKNKGCGYTKHKCVQLATGKYCGFLDPDDSLERNALKEMFQAFEKNKNSSLVYSRINLCDENLNTICKSNYAMQINKPKSYLLEASGKVSHFAMFKLDLYKKTVGININLMKAVDQDLYLKLEEVGRLILVDKHLYNYRQHKGGISLNENVDKALAWNIKVRIDACERRDISIEKVIPKIIQDAKSIHEFYQNSSDYRLGSMLLKPIRFIKSKFIKYK